MILLERCVEEYGSNCEASASGTSRGGTFALPSTFGGTSIVVCESDLADAVDTLIVELLVFLIADLKSGTVLL